MNLAGLRELLLKSKNHEIDLERLDPSETVYKAIIIREFMKEKNIPDVPQGIREFFAFQRGRLRQLGWISA